MGNKYVSPYGNNANAGTDSSPTGAWLTVEYGVDTMSDGDVLYIAPGIWRDVITIGVTASVETIIKGDPLNTQRFTDASGNLLDSGPVIITNLLTNDVSNSTNTVVVDTNSKSNLTFENLWIEAMAGGTAYGLAIGSSSTNIKIKNCYLFCITAPAIYITIAAATNANIIIENSILYSGSLNTIAYIMTKHSSDYDCGCIVKNCCILAPGGYGINISTTATNTNFGGGITVQNCTIISKDGGLRSSTVYNAAITYKINICNSMLLGGVGIVQSAGAEGDAVIESYNLIACPVARTTVAIGSGSVAYSSNAISRSVRLDMGQSLLFGFSPMMFLAPYSTSRTIGFGNNTTPAPLLLDLLNRIKPSGNGPIINTYNLGVGSLEYHDYGTKDTSTYDAASASLKLMGPGDHKLKVAVNNVATTLSIKTKYDPTTYSGVNYPQVMISGYNNLGINTQVVTATTAASGAWETLTFSSFTPSGKGWVDLYLINRTANLGTGINCTGICWFDTLNSS